MSAVQQAWRDRFPENGPFTLPATKAAIAAHLHLTPEHFSRLLHELADDGLLRIEGRRITLLQPQWFRPP